MCLCVCNHDRETSSDPPQTRWVLMEDHALRHRVANNRYVSSLSSIVIVGLIAVQCEKNRFSFFSLSKIIMLLDADSEYRSCNYLLEISLDIDKSENNGR